MRISDGETQLLQRLARQVPELREFLSGQRERVRDLLEQAGPGNSEFIRGQAIVYRELLQLLEPK